MYRVRDNLYIGNGEEAANRDLLEEYGIKAIVNCTKDWPNWFEGDEELGIEYLRVPIDDPDPEYKDYLDQAVFWIRERIERGRPVLVHCAAGRSRSCAVVLSYLCSDGMTPDAAWEQMRSISDNFILQDIFREILEERFRVRQGP